MIGSDGSHGGRLVESWLGSTLIERLAHIERSVLGKHTLGIGGTVLPERGRCTLVVTAHILSHAQHIEALLCVVATLHNGDELL